MSSDGTVIPGRPQGSNPFPFDSAFLDVCSRLGLPVEQCAELESFWWFMSPCDMTPEDFAAAVMKVLPEESEKEASMRRMGILTSHESTSQNVEVVKVKKKARRNRSIIA